MENQNHERSVDQYEKTKEGNSTFQNPPPYQPRNNPPSNEPQNKPQTKRNYNLPPHRAFPFGTSEEVASLKEEAATECARNECASQLREKLLRNEANQSLMQNPGPSRVTRQNQTMDTAKFLMEAATVFQSADPAVAQDRNNNNRQRRNVLFESHPSSQATNISDANHAEDPNRRDCLRVDGVNSADDQKQTALAQSDEDKPSSSSSTRKRKHHGLALGDKLLILEQDLMREHKHLSTLVEIFPDVDRKILEEQCSMFGEGDEALQQLIDSVLLQRKNEVLVECSICCDAQIKIEDTSECTKGHMYCNACIKNGIGVAIGNGVTKISCFEAGCEGEFNSALLQMLLDATIFTRLMSRQQAEEVQAAGLDGLESCPFCDFACIFPLEGDIFTCLSDECKKNSCRKCKKEYIVPHACEENATDTNVRVFIEDKMSEALIRKCWNCKYPYVKSDGCNKIRCAKCGSNNCYICRSKATGYNHFNGQGGDKFYLCPLWSDMNELHGEAVKKAGDDAKREALTKNPQANLIYDPVQGLPDVVEPPNANFIGAYPYPAAGLAGNFDLGEGLPNVGEGLFANPAAGLYPNPVGCVEYQQRVLMHGNDQAVGMIIRPDYGNGQPVRGRRGAFFNIRARAGRNLAPGERPQMGRIHPPLDPVVAQRPMIAAHNHVQEIHNYAQQPNYVQQPAAHNRAQAVHNRAQAAHNPAQEVHNRALQLPRGIIIQRCGPPVMHHPGNAQPVQIVPLPHAQLPLPPPDAAAAPVMHGRVQAIQVTGRVRQGNAQIQQNGQDRAVAQAFVAPLVLPPVLEVQIVRRDGRVITQLQQNHRAPAVAQPPIVPVAQPPVVPVAQPPVVTIAQADVAPAVAQFPVVPAVPADVAPVVRAREVPAVQAYVQNVGQPAVTIAQDAAQINFVGPRGIQGRIRRYNWYNEGGAYVRNLAMRENGVAHEELNVQP